MLYPSDPCIDESRGNLELALISIYLLILQFLCKAIRLCDKTTPSRAVKAFWDPDDIVDFEKSCQDLEARLDMEVQNCERSYNKIDRAESLHQGSALKDLLLQLKELKDDARVADLWKRLDEVERSDILIWTSEIPYKDHHTTASEGRTKDTGEWLFEHEQYKAWQSSDESMILWLHGIRRSLFC